MDNQLNQLKQTLLAHIQHPEQEPLKYLGLFQTHQVQALRQVPIHQPTLILVIAGRKTLLKPGVQMVADQGQLLMVAAGESVNLTNDPCPEQGLYIALTIGFSDEVVRQFQLLQQPHLSNLAQPTSGALNGLDTRFLPASLDRQALPISSALLACAQQWVALCQQQSTSPALHTLKAAETLVHLEQILPSPYKASFHQFLNSAASSWKSKTLNLVQSDLAHSWKLTEVCQRLGTSEPTLRRHLQAEGTNFRELLEDSRLLAALGMLQESYRPIGHIAMDVGYNNQGHFTERFKKRFAMSPSELRQTREPQSAIA